MKLHRLLPLALSLLAVSPAGALYVNSKGTGQLLLFPYYTTNAGQSTLLSVTNTTDRAKALRVAFHEGYNSREVLDFFVFLAPRDSWTATVFAQDGTDARIMTRDESCTAPDTSQWTAPFPGGGYQQVFLEFAYTGFSQDTGPVDLTRRREGHFEIVELAELEGQLAAAITGIHPPDCRPLQAFDPGSTNIKKPGGGLSGDFAVIDVAEGTLFGGRATAIDDYSQWSLFNDTGTVYQYLAMANSGDGRADAVLPAEDGSSTLSYSIASADGFSGSIRALDAVLMADSLYGSMSREAGVGSHTEWVVTAPTKFLHTDPALLPSSQDGTILGPHPPFGEVFGSVYPGGSCSRYTASAYDREGRAVTFVQDPEFSAGPPGQHPQHALCFATNVVHFSDRAADGTTPLLGSRLGSKLWNPVPAAETASVRIDVGARPGTSAFNLLPAGTVGPALRGLPLIGFEAVRYVNGNVTPGTLANYTSASPLRSRTVCAKANGEPMACP